MKFNLTFNKPAAAMFFAEKGMKALKLKIDGATVMIKAVTKDVTRSDVFPLESRTRGGVGVTVSGRIAQAFLNAGLERGVHIPLEATGRNWIAGEAIGEAGVKPSKVVPTARLWRVKEETASKADDAPARAPRKAAKKTAKKAATKRAAKSEAAQAAQ